MMDDTELPEEDLFNPLNPGDDTDDEETDPDDDPESHGFTVTDDYTEPDTY